MSAVYFSSLKFRAGCSAVLACGMIGLSGCSDSPEEPAPIPPVQTFVLGELREPPFRSFPGTVAAADSSEMSFDVGGRLIEFPASQGLNAKKGELLGRLDDENFVSRRDAAQSDFVTAREEVTRRRQLLDRGVISRSEFDQFQQRYEVAEAALRQANRALEDTRMVAPFDGQVARTLVSNQENVRAGQPVLVYQFVGGLEVNIQIPESSMTIGGRGITVQDARGMIEAKVQFPTIPGLEIPLDLLSFSTEASRSARTFRVTFVMDPPEEKNVLPGMTCTVLVRFRDPNAAAADLPQDEFELPLRAVGTSAGESQVWILDSESGRVRPVPVEIVRLSGENAIVRSADLTAGVEVVSAGVRFLYDGMEVKRLETVSR